MKGINEILVCLILIHGLIHLLGFAKSAKLMELDQFSSDVPPKYGFLWLISSILFITSAVFIILNFRYWEVVFVISLAMSQLLILKFWVDAKVGTIANVVILFAFLLSISVK